MISTNNLNHDMTICSIVILAFYLCAGLLCVIAGVSPALMSETEILPDSIPDAMLNPHYIEFSEETAAPYYTDTELYQVALKVFSGLAVFGLSAIMILTFAKGCVRYVVSKVRSNGEEIECPDIFPSVVCLFIWIIPALVLNLVGKWMVCNQHISAEQMISDIAGLDSLLSVQMFVLLFSIGCYIAPFLSEFISSLVSKEK